MSKNTQRVAIEAYHDGRQQTKHFHPNAWAAIKGDRNAQGWRRVVRSSEPLPVEIQQRMNELRKPETDAVLEDILAEVNGDVEAATGPLIEGVSIDENGVVMLTDAARNAILEQKAQEFFPGLKIPDFSQVKGEGGILALQKDNQPAKRGRKANATK